MGGDKEMEDRLSKIRVIVRSTRKLSKATGGTLCELATLHWSLFHRIRTV